MEQKDYLDYMHEEIMNAKEARMEIERLKRMGGLDLDVSEDSDGNITFDIDYKCEAAKIKISRQEILDVMLNDGLDVISAIKQLIKKDIYRTIFLG